MSFTAQHVEIARLTAERDDEATRRINAEKALEANRRMYQALIDERAMNQQSAMAELAERIDTLDGGDPEGAHDELDRLLFDHMPVEVRFAILRLRDRCAWWATA